VKLLFVRHGETDWNRELRYQGHRETLLNARGIEQAKMAAEALKEFDPAALYTSNLKRAVQTARIIGEILNLSPKPEPGLREIDFGCWEGKTYPEVKELFPKEVAMWRKNPLKAVVPGGECLKDVVERVLDAVERICSEAAGNTVLVTHGGPIRLLLCHIGVDGAMWQYPVKPGSITILEYRGGRLALAGQRLQPAD